VANKERVIEREKTAMRMSEEDQRLLAEALNMEVGEVPMRIAFTVKTTDGDRTYEQQRMNLMTMTQIYSQYAEKTIPLVMQIYGPQGMQMKQQAPDMWAYMARILVGSSKLVDGIFKFFGIYDTENYVPNPDQLDKMVDMMKGMAQSFGGVPQEPMEQGMAGMQPGGLGMQQGMQQGMLGEGGLM